MFNFNRLLFVGMIIILLVASFQFGDVTISAGLSSGKDKKPDDSASKQPSANDTGNRSKASHRGLERRIVDRFFTNEVWAKVGERICLKCHHVKGDASDSEFLLQDTLWSRDSLVKNRKAFEQMASAKQDGKSRLLMKITGHLDHGGQEVLKKDSTGYRILARFVRHTSGKSDDRPAIADYNPPPFFEGIEMMTPRRVLRRVTLSLAARLPTKKEQAAVEKDGPQAMNAILDQVMKEDAFYERLQEGFNDIFLTVGSGSDVLSGEYFKSKNWPKKYNLKHVGGEDAQRKARYKLYDDYRNAILHEPLELIEYIVRNDRPFTELATADYIMVTPYSARAYGIYDELHDKFKDPDDPFEYIPTKLRALKSNWGSKKMQKSDTGFYPHAGFLSMFHYLKRYPTTETNRNRHRARMYYQQFLGVDIMKLGSRVSDAVATDAKYKIPTMQAADCVVCHKTMDPVAGLFQEFDARGHIGPRKDGWYKDMFRPGFEGEDLPKKDQWRALPWLGQRTAKDPRFAVAMVQHVYYILMGRKVLQPPENIDNPMFGSKRRAYRQQRKLIEEAAKRFTTADFNLKVVFKTLLSSDFYRADGLAAVVKHPRRRAELDDVGLVRLQTPEQLERKLHALFGQKWGRLVGRGSKFKILYGGIDSKSVTERMTDPSGAMGAIQRIMSNDVACKNVANDFSKKPSQRRLFPNIELSVVPGNGPTAESKIRQAIVHLHEHLLGKKHAIDHTEIERTYRLFVGIINDAKAKKGLDKRGSYHCGRVDGKRLDDPHYTLRAWRGIVTYLLRQHDFLYE